MTPLLTVSPHHLTPNETGDRDYLTLHGFLSSPGAAAAMRIIRHVSVGVYIHYTLSRRPYPEQRAVSELSAPLKDHYAADMAVCERSFKAVAGVEPVTLQIQDRLRRCVSLEQHLFS